MSMPQHPGSPYPQPGLHPNPAPPEGPSGPGGRAVSVLLAVSIVTTGLMAGLFLAYDVSVMPGLARSDDRLYAEAMQNFNELIDGNGLFGMTFLAAFLAPVAAAIVGFVKGRRGVAVWAALAAALYLVVLLITFLVNIPLNDELAGLGDPGRATDLSVIEDFKGTWAMTNVLRTAFCTLALGSLAYAMLLQGRASALRPARGSRR